MAIRSSWSEPQSVPSLVFADSIELFPEKAMAYHSSTLAWKIPWTEELGRLQSMGSRSRTWLNDFTFAFHFHALEKEMATHSSVLAWRIPGTGEPGGLLSVRLHRVGHNWSDLAATPKSDWLYSLQPKMEKLYTASKSKTRSWLWFRSWTPYCKIHT